MSNPKLFNPDNEFDKEAREIYKVVSETLAEQSNTFLLDCINCEKFAEVIIRKGLILFTNVIPEILYKEILNRVLEQYNFIGTSGAYYYLLKLFYGQSATIEFQRLKPAVFKIKVSNVDVRTYPLIDSTNNYIVDGENYGIVMADRILDLSEENLLKLIENIKPCGFVVKIEVE